MVSINTSGPVSIDSLMTDMVFFAEIIQNIPEIVYLYDLRKTELIFANKSISTILGYSKDVIEQILKNKGKDFVHPEDIGFVQNHFKNIGTIALGEKRKYIVRVKDSKGEWRWMENVECLLVSYTHKDGKFVLGIAKDITEYVKTSIYTVKPGEQVVRKELRCNKCTKLLAIENLLIPSLEIKCLRCGEINTIIGGVHDQVFITDDKGRILYVNDEVEKVTGYKFDEIVGKTPAIWGKQMPHAFYEKMWMDILKKKKAIAVRVTNKRKDGRLYPVLLKISPILDENSEVNYFLAIETMIQVDEELK